MTLQDDQERANEASLDLAYVIVKTLGIIGLCERFGMTLKPWVRERQIRDLHRWAKESGVQAKADRVSADIAGHRSLTLEEAAERLRRNR